MKNPLSFRQKSYKVEFKKDVNVCFSLDCERSYNREAGSCGLRTYAYRTLETKKGTYIVSEYLLEFLIENNKAASYKFSVEKNIPFEVLEEYAAFTEFDRKKTVFLNFKEAKNSLLPQPLTKEQWEELDIL